MNYTETTEWLFSQLPMYQREGKSAYKADLENSTILDSRFGHPHRKYRCIHVAGTNGKGSVSHMLASIFQEAGYKTALYTSPHLKDFRERIKINGKEIPEEYVTRFVEENREFFENLHPSFFEMTSTMAFCWFAEEKVDIAIIEVGLGGRLDSTNVITPELSVITNISLDHTALLGNTLEQIATEKAGIIKEKIPVVVGTFDTRYAHVLRQTAIDETSPISFASEEWNYTENSDGSYNYSSTQGDSFCKLKCELSGIYQTENIATVLQAITTLNGRGFNIDKRTVTQGVAKVVTNTHLMGRWQILNENPYTVCDTGHNPGAFVHIVKQMETHQHETLRIVIGMVNDKDIETVLSMLPKSAVYYFCKPSVKRAMDEISLMEIGKKFSLNGTCYPTVTEAFNAAKIQASPKDMIYIGGSTFVVAEII